jgi:uncharacterized protein (UPF0548 family)
LGGLAIGAARGCERWTDAPATDSLDGTGGVVDRYECDAVVRSGEARAAAFERLEGRLLRYEVFPPRIMDARVCSGDGRLHEGTTIVQRVRLGPLRLEFAVRVLRVWSGRGGEADEAGFSYVTLKGHPERGVSTFLLRRPADADKITFRIDVRSRPGSFLARVARPYARRLQRHATEAALGHLTTDAA